MKLALRRWLGDAVARVPVSISTKLLVAFLAIAALLVVVGAVGLAELGMANRRTEDLAGLQRKIAAYRQIQHDTLAQLHSVSSALLAPEAARLEATLRQLNQFGYDLDRLQFVAQDEVELFARVRQEYEIFIAIVQEVVEKVRAGQVVAGLKLQTERAAPQAERLERLTNELVNKAEADMVTRTDEGFEDYLQSRRVMIAIALGAIALALGLGYALSSSLVRPVLLMDRRFSEIAAGDFTKRVTIANRDELGELADDLNRMNDELGQLYRQIEAASRHKSEFLANMSHELRTPLNAIIGFSEVLTEQMFGELNDKQMEYLRDIHSSGHHLLTLINDVLDLSKIEAGKMELELSCVDLGQLLEHSTMLVRERAQRHGLTLALDIGEGLTEWVADERKLKQSVVNLLSNAVKFTPAGGSVMLRARHLNGFSGRAGDWAEVSVSDSGIGIKPEDQALVFEEFRQASGDVLRKGEGTGLGLALVKRFVELHGGQIALVSAPGQGSTFTITLPQHELRVLQ